VAHLQSGALLAVTGRMASGSGAGDVSTVRGVVSAGRWRASDQYPPDASGVEKCSRGALCSVFVTTRVHVLERPVPSTCVSGAY
jgi:hypothetical protein